LPKSNKTCLFLPKWHGKPLLEIYNPIQNKELYFLLDSGTGFAVFQGVSLFKNSKASLETGADNGKDYRYRPGNNQLGRVGHGRHGPESAD
jgi:hypothetical protein